ncbi:hypothetical protein D3C81_2233920 [compost metagenome]
MRGVFEISKRPVATTLTGIIQALFEGPTIVRCGMQVDVEQRKAQMTRDFLNTLLVQQLQVLIGLPPG